MSDELEIQFSTKKYSYNGKSYSVINLVGDLNSSNTQDSRASLENLCKNETNLIINASKIDYVSSPGIGLFITSYRILKNKQGKLVISNISDSANKPLQAIGLNNFIDFIQDSTIEDYF